MRKIIIILIILLFTSCNKSNDEKGKNGIGTFRGYCGKQVAELESKIKTCNNREFNININCNIYADNGTFEDNETSDKCLKNIQKLSCKELNGKMKLKDIKDCYLYDKAENYITKKEYCIEKYDKFCKNLYSSCSKQLTDSCNNAKFVDEREGHDHDIHFKKNILANYCDISGTVETNDIKCYTSLFSCGDFEKINFNIDEYYTDCD